MRGVILNLMKKKCIVISLLIITLLILNSCFVDKSSGDNKQNTNNAVQIENDSVEKDFNEGVAKDFSWDEDKLDSGEEGYGPDDQRQGADDEGFINLADAAVSCHDGFHYIKRGGTDITIDDTDGHQKHAEMKSIFLFLLSVYVHFKNSFFHLALS